jgi:hypothetical protein
MIMKDRYTNTVREIEPEFRHKGLRIGTLWFSTVQGTGDVTISPFFDEQLDPDTQIDILMQCEFLLSQEIEKLREEMYNRHVEARKRRGLPV